MSKRIIVTGGAGFLGSHLCDRLLERGDHVVCVDDFSTGHRNNIAQHANNERFEVLDHDVAQPWSSDIDQIFHLACPASPMHYRSDPVRTIRTCVMGSMNVLDIAKATGARVLLASTSEVYGDPSVHPQVESYWGHVNPNGPRACYDEGKRCAEALAVSYAQQYNVQIRIARIFNTYGPRLHPHDGRVVSNFIRQALDGDDITIFGAGTHTRSFCYVDDTIAGLMALMEADTPDPVNIGNPHEITILKLAEMVIDKLQSKSKLVYEPMPGDDPQRRKPDITRAKAVLGWAPKVLLDDGLTTTIEAFRASYQASANG